MREITLKYPLLIYLTDWLFPIAMAGIFIEWIIKNHDISTLPSLLFIEAIISIIAYSIHRDIKRYKKRYNLIRKLLIYDKETINLLTQVSFAIEELEKHRPDSYLELIDSLITMLVGGDKQHEKNG